MEKDKILKQILFNNVIVISNIMYAESLKLLFQRITVGFELHILLSNVSFCNY